MAIFKQRLLSCLISSEVKKEDETFYGEISECEGVWGNGKTLESFREDLQDALEGWMILGFRLGHKFPI